MRPRKKDRHLPPCIYHRHGAYYLVKAGKWTKLGDDLPAALAEYGRRMSNQAAGGMPKLIDEAFDTITKGKSDATVKQYRTAADKLAAMLKDFNPDQVRQRDMNRVKRLLADTPNMGNRVLTVARLVFQYALDEELIDSNPAVGVKRHEETKRTRLITSGEYAAIYAKAGDRLQVIMDLLYLTGQRIGDVLAIRRADLRGDGLYVEQGKTGARLLVKWSTELRAVVARAKALHGNVKAMTLLHGRRGKQVDYKTVQEQWTLACKRAGAEDAHLHDIRAMAGTAIKNQMGKAAATALLGHASPSMTARYLRDREVPQVQGPSFGRALDVGQKRPKK